MDYTCDWIFWNTWPWTKHPGHKVIWSSHIIHTTIILWPPQSDNNTNQPIPPIGAFELIHLHRQVFQIMSICIKYKIHIMVSFKKNQNLPQEDYFLSKYTYMIQTSVSICLFKGFLTMFEQLYINHILKVLGIWSLKIVSLARLIWLIA